MAGMMLSRIEVKNNILEDEKYKYLFSVEEVNKLVLQGIPFRDAYRQVGASIEAGNFTYDTSIHHTHEGSIGRLNTNEISSQMKKVVGSFPFEKVRVALLELVSSKGI
jgi:argininosuccinate lyase